MRALEVIEAFESDLRTAENEGLTKFPKEAYFEAAYSIGGTEAVGALYVGAERFRVTVVKEA